MMLYIFWRYIWLKCDLFLYQMNILWAFIACEWNNFKFLISNSQFLLIIKNFELTQFLLIDVENLQYPLMTIDLDISIRIECYLLFSKFSIVHTLAFFFFIDPPFQWLQGIRRVCHNPQCSKLLIKMHDCETIFCSFSFCLWPRWQRADNFHYNSIKFHLALARTKTVNCDNISTKWPI